MHSAREEGHSTYAPRKAFDETDPVAITILLGAGASADAKISNRYGVYWSPFKRFLRERAVSTHAGLWVASDTTLNFTSNCAFRATQSDYDVNYFIALGASR